MAAKLIYGKTLAILLLQNWESFKAEYSIEDSKSIKFFSNDDRRLTYDLITARSLYIYVGRIMKSHYMTKLLKRFSYNQKFVPWGYLPLSPF